ncbi:PDDEXK nuclease domain-containing protein [Methylosarcina fibrata]|uniref:PDDEXK nuclease domain-containing protein n=1 Tax=Methylosarcina fibrata TaxID=105972 RepID=UPI00037DB7E3|nr:PDDEXK nuclease domain-containing protein [Methylosarcina fibrata]
MAKNKPAAPKPADALLLELRGLIDSARQHIAQTANATLTMLYWRIGHRIGVELLQKERAPYGQEIVSAVSRELTQAYGRGFADRNLWHMKRFAEAFPDEKIVSALSTVLSWTHFRQIIYLERPLQREFYAEMCRIERWSTRTLEKKIGGMLYERTAISKKPEAVVEMEIAKLRERDQISTDLVFRDPYLLDFLGLQGVYSERDLESAILADMERFLLEMGDGFCFVARQKRLIIGADDFYLDLLFYHRKLQRLVAVELKLEKFQAAHKGQMELYLRWLDRYERQPGEEAPIGLILCASINREEIEVLQLDGSSIRVAEYLTELPEREALRSRLHHAIAVARERAAAATLSPQSAMAKPTNAVPKPRRKKKGDNA